MPLRIGSLTVRSQGAYAVTPSGVVRPRVFRAEHNDFADYDRQLIVGRRLARHRGLLTANVVRHEPASQRPDQICATEHAEACAKLDRGRAGERATELLLSYLLPYQQRTALRCGYFDVCIHDPKLVKYCLDHELPVMFETMRFRIYRGFPNGNVKLKTARDRHFRFTFCLHPMEPYPTDDICLAQMMMILATPNDFIQQANVTEGRVERHFDAVFGAVPQNKLSLPYLADPPAVPRESAVAA